MYTGAQRIALSVGFTRSRNAQLVKLAVLGPVLVCLCGVFGSVAGVVSAGIAGGFSGDPPPVVVGVFSGLALLLSAAWIGSFIAFVARAGAWIEGTRLTVRNRTTRTVDLADARAVGLSAHAEPRELALGVAGMRTPILTVSDARGTVRLRLRSRDGALLPPGEMHALAEALSAASAARRPGADAAVGWLRAIAADPRSLFS